MLPLFTLAAGHVKTLEQLEPFARSAASGITAGSYTLLPRTGNEGTVFCEHPELPGSYLNALGMPNGGLEYLKKNLEAMIKLVKEHSTPDNPKQLRISIAPIASGDLATMVKFLRRYAEDIIVEVNTGCPNVWDGAVQKPLICHNHRAFRYALDEVASESGTTRVAVKLSLLPDNVRKRIIGSCHLSVVDELVTMNTRPNCPTHGHLSVPFAGLSGRAIAEEAQDEVTKTRALIAKFDTRGRPRMGLVGVGGLESPETVLAMADRGVGHVQIGSYAFVHGPRAFGELISGTLDLIEQREGAR